MKIQTETNKRNRIRNGAHNCTEIGGEGKRKPSNSGSGCSPPVLQAKEKETYSHPALSTGHVLRGPDGCLKLQTVPNSICTAFPYTYTPMIVSLMN